MPVFKVNLQIQNGSAIVSWPAGITTNQVQIQSSSTPSGPWQDIGPATTSTSISVPVAGGSMFFRGVISGNSSMVSSGSWARKFGSTAADSGTAVAVDSTGNILTAGYFQGSVDFGGGLLTSAGGYDLVLAKYSPSGAHIWSKRFGSSGNELVNTIALDSAGNIYLGGSFYGTGNFGGANLVSAGDADAFIAKYSPQGDPIWSQSFGASLPDVINSIACDSQGNVIATGFLQGSVTIGRTTISSFGNGLDVFLAKFAPDGSNLWAKNFYNAGTEYGNSVAVDKRINPATGIPYDNIVLAGYFNGYVNFSGGQVDANLLNTAGGYIVKFSPTGDQIWAKAHGGSNGATRFWSMALDSNGDIVVSGDFSQQTDLGGGIVTGGSWGTDLFLAKYSGTDGAYRWAAPIVGYEASVGRPTSISTDSQNNIIFTGYFQGTYNFGGQSLSSGAGVSDGMVVKYAATGARVWAQGFGSAGTANGNGVVVDALGCPVVAGYFNNSADPAGLPLTSAGASDMVLTKLNP